MALRLRRHLRTRALFGISDPSDSSRRAFLQSCGAVLGASYAGAGFGLSIANSDLAYLSIREASALIKARTLSPVELTRACLARIERLNPIFNAFITVTSESALAQARAAESELQRNQWRGPLHGIPVALKDLIDTAGVRTTAGSAVFKDRIPTDDASVVSKLKAAGAVLLGKLNMHEFAYGATSVTSFFGPVKNPWAVDRIAGGSSGGAAAAVAAGLCFAALGSDTGGSIREPAAFCGIVGLKPTYGRVSNDGVVPLCWSEDHIGPLTRSVSDAALVLKIIANEQRAAQGQGVWHPGTPVRVGVPRDHFDDHLDAEVGAAVERALAILKTLGAQIQQVPLEVSTDRVVIRAEAYAYHAKLIAATPTLYQPVTLAKLRMGENISAQSYILARRDLDRLRRLAPAIFSSIDVLVTPTSPVVAPKAAEWPSDFDAILAGEGVLLQNTRPFDLNGLPSISIPCGTTQAGLPIGVQISGAPWAEACVLAVAHQLEQAMPWRALRI